ncbi:CDP-alcohol phosphatidyltransferase [Streptomyces viridochromogenes]|uniref:CDP-alcohol phosphatidyltransferase n=1 Tax=Streptomyces viridochromogenes TaxID=1938 RepID=UPI0022773E0B|nr:CDP-alcohol phosphatidyltransferase [Streptomyces viridochromogenes]
MADGSAPATEGAAPVAEGPVPATEGSAPATEESIPVAEGPVPATQESIPAAEESVPATDESVPATDESAPATDGSAPPPTDQPFPAAEEPAPTNNEPAAADGEEAPQGPPAPDDESRTGGAGGNNSAEGEAEARPPTPYLRWTLTALAAALIHICLQMPNTPDNLKAAEFIRLPAEAIIGAALLLALPRRPRLIVAALSGAFLGALTTLNILDIGYNEYLGRGFNVVLDWELLDDAQSYLKDSLGGTTTTLLTIGVILLVVLLITLVALATIRIANVLAHHRTTASKGALIAGTVWITCTAFGLQVAGIPIAAEHTAAVLKLQAHRAMNTLRDEAEFAKDTKSDTFGNTPPAQLVPDLRGKDVLFTFIESYGRSALEDPQIAPGVTSTVDTGTKALADAGFHAKSGWLTSATFGGSSWLGHSTTLSGLWIDNQQRYRTVMASDHLSLTKAFQKTGDWDTVGLMPGVQKGWPEQKYFGLDKVYNAFRLGYKGPKFSWSTMPDQYALEAFQRQVHGKKRDKPLMAEIILTSSHQPWAPIPEMVGWNDLGDGSIFKPIQKSGTKPSDIISDSTRSKQEYGKSISYSVASLTQWLERYGTDDTVLVFLGDHQPMSRVSGAKASRDVPISIVAKDPKVLDKIADWNWTDGLRPAPKAPVWKMSSFRDRFLTAYGSTPHPSN